MSPQEACAKLVCSRRGAGVSAGFSLVEVMVAMAIGMLGIIVMMQMFSVFEGQKRTTMGSDDAISGGAVSLYGLQRDLQQSGLGVSAGQVIGCTVSGLLNPGTTLLPLVPVTINSALIPVADQDANTDSLLIVSGNGNGAVEGDSFVAPAPVGSTAFAVHTPTAFSVGDKLIAVPQTRPLTCSLAVSTMAAGGINPNIAVAPATGYAVSAVDKLFNLGSAPTVRVYRVRNQNLTVCDFTVNNCGLTANKDDASIWVPVANNVVSLRAEYGRDTNAAGMDGVIDVWDQTVPLPAFPTGNTAAACALLRVSAMRVVLVARSGQPEKTLDWPSVSEHVMTPLILDPKLDPRIWYGNDAVAQAIDSAAAAAVAITLPDPDPTWPTWQDFRYKVFQTIVPLRNITSQGVVTGC